MSNSYNVQDKNFTVSKALPAAGAAAVSDGLDLGAITFRGARTENMEFRLTVPAVPDLVNAKTIIYDVETDDNSAFSSAKKVITNLITSTGAGGVGAAAVDERFRLPTDCEQYVRIRATVLADGGDNTGVDFTLKALF